MAIAALFQPALNNDRMHGVTPYARWLSLISAGYFITDVCIVAKHFKEHGVEPLCHALICITFFGFSALKRRMQYFVPRVLMFECSTPFVHARWLLHALGKSKTRAYKRNGLAMIGAFFVFRVCYGTRARPPLPPALASAGSNCLDTLGFWLCRPGEVHTPVHTQHTPGGPGQRGSLHAGVIYDFFKARNAYLANPPAVREPITKTTMNIITTAGCSISVLNWFWFYKMCRGAAKVFRRPVESKASQARLASADNIPAPSDPEQTPGLGDTTRPSAATRAQSTAMPKSGGAAGGVATSSGAGVIEPSQIIGKV